MRYYADFSMLYSIQGVKIIGMIALGLVAVVCVASLSEHMGGVRRSEMMETGLHSSDSDFDVADAILSSAGVHDKEGSISASMAALAAQVGNGRLACRESLVAFYVASSCRFSCRACLLCVLHC